MCTQQEKTLINNINRTVIASAGIVGALMDGFHGGDVLCIFSMVFWLWQSECNAIEEKCVDQLKRTIAIKN